MNTILNIDIPGPWQHLSDRDLRLVFQLLSMELSSVEVKMHFLMKTARMKVIGREGALFIIKVAGREYAISPQGIAETLSLLDWLDGVPGYPTRLSRIGRHKALSADFEGVAFEKFLMLDNLYSGYLHTRREELLRRMAKILYDAPHIRISRLEGVSVFYWFASLKQYLANTFRHFFSSSDSQSEYADIGRALMDSMNAQIRALTGGDITKEQSVLAMDTWRALTELDAKAKDYEDMQKELKH